MSCAARYSETTSLEFILNPFKFFFTNYVAKIAPYPPPNIHHLETQIRSPTILRSHTANAQRLPVHVASSPTPLLAVLLSTVRYAPLHESSRSSNDLTAAPDSLSARAHFVASNADVMRFTAPRYFFSSTRGIAVWSTTTGAVLHVHSRC
ncbi:hypothetical protein GNZ13_28465 [Paraburkholderia sp. 5N]|uniref:Uncharacterized protein n=1 Tax=Paraburkholderia elongata TaxID=2675747 RepID=A0A972NRN6_9BURK|nr:hypothetical protein [Paraburkholderia elongata]